MTNKYIVAVDGGGTKTAICLMNTETKEKKEYEFGSSNYRVVGLEETRTNLIEGYKHAINSSGIEIESIAGTVFGLSGLDTEEDFEIYSNLIDELKISEEKYYICNDAEAAFYSKGELPGLVIIGGTGSIGYGVSQNNKHMRCGGYGSPISDLGSGYWIGIEVLKDLLRYCDGYCDYQLVFDDIRRHCTVEDFKQLPHLVVNYKGNEISALARLVCDSALKNDTYCRGIVDRAASHTADIAKAIYKELKFKNMEKVDVVLAGSLFKNQYYQTQFITCFSEELEIDNVNYKVAIVDTTEGGLIIGTKKWCE